MTEFTKKCPHCGGYIERIHRHRFDRFISIFVKVRRYQCQNPHCEWEGLMRLNDHQYNKK